MHLVQQPLVFHRRWGLEPIPPRNVLGLGLTVRMLNIDTTLVCLHDDGLTTTTLPNGYSVDARAQDDPTYRARAESLGYGEDTARMSREHGLGHVLLAHWLGLPASPTMQGVASGEHWPLWQTEEAAVLALQAFANAAGVSLEALAAKIDKEQR